MGQDYLTQIGLAGMLIYLFLKEMFAFLAKRNGANGTRMQKSGDINPAQWRAWIGEEVGKALDTRLASRNEEFRRILKEELQSLRRGK